MVVNLNEAEDMNRGVAPPGPYWLKARLKRGGAGEDGLLRLARNQHGLMVELECTIIDNDEWRGQKLIDYITVGLQEYDPSDIDAPPIFADKKEGLQTAARIGLSKLKALVNSAYGLMPSDTSAEACEKRTLESYAVLDGICFMAQVEVRPSEGKYRERNVIDFIITPDDPAYKPRGSTSKAVATRAKPKSTVQDDRDDQIPF
jgi:hypothetical protein